MNTMLRYQKAIQISACVTLLLATAACRGNTANTPAGTDGVRVTDVTLGRSIGGDKTVTDKTDNFNPNDTIYASVATEGAAQSATLRAKWTFEGGQVVDDSSRTIAPGSRERTEFHIAKPDGWPTGRYTVEVFLDNKSADTQSFEVR